MVLPLVRALNAAGLDKLATDGPNIPFDEAEALLEEVIENFGATPPRVHHLVMILINDAQTNAFSSGPWDPDLGRALDCAERAVTSQLEFQAYARSVAPDYLESPVTSGLVNAYLTLARTQAACALQDEAEQSLATAWGHFSADDHEDEWGSVLRGVEREIRPRTEHASKRTDDDRVDMWLWYGPSHQ